MKKKILILAGGYSKERDISLKTARAAYKQIKKNYNCRILDPKSGFVNEIRKFKPNVIFNALHGKNGEDGKVQSIFEYLKIPYTHSGVISSMIAMNKYFSKQLFIKNKIKTPNFFFLNKQNFLGINLRKKIKKNKLAFPIVIKPNDEGSSIGVKICKNLFSLKNLTDQCLQKKIKKLKLL